MSVIQSIGIFGGSFDPVHNGHVLVAKAALEELSLDRLFIVPAARSPFKPEQQPAAAEVRLRLLRLAFAFDDSRSASTPAPSGRGQLSAARRTPQSRSATGRAAKGSASSVTSSVTSSAGIEAAILAKLPIVCSKLLAAFEQRYL